MFDQKSAQAAVQAISGKWTLVVLAELARGPKSHNELARAAGIDNKNLSRSLHSMERLDLIERQVNVGRPLRTYYHLTPYAQPLVELLDELGQWWSESS